MKVLVTGGAGFIGSHLCQKLIELSHDVICLDNLLTGSKNNIAKLLENPKFRFVDGDAEKHEVEKVDFIFHMASPASPRDYQRHAIETMTVNSIGTLNMLKTALKFNSGFLLASTSEIYGDPKVHPQKEDYWGNVNPIGPRSCYDEAKRFAESLVKTFISQKGVNARIVRIFNTYGPRMQKDDGRVVSNFINQALKNEPLTVYGKGEQTRSFCYVTDLVEGLISAAFTKDTKDGVYNLGNPDERKIIDIARLVIKLTSSKSEIIFNPLPQDDPAMRCPDISKAKSLLKWEPKISLEVGLLKTIEYYKNN